MKNESVFKFKYSYALYASVVILALSEIFDSKWLLGFGHFIAVTSIVIGIPLYSFFTFALLKTSKVKNNTFQSYCDGVFKSLPVFLISCIFTKAGWNILGDIVFVFWIIQMLMHFRLKK